MQQKDERERLGQAEGLLSEAEQCAATERAHSPREGIVRRLAQVLYLRRRRLQNQGNGLVIQWQAVPEVRQLRGGLLQGLRDLAETDDSHLRQEANVRAR